MGEFASELRQCLAELASSDTDRTVITPSRVVRESAPRRARARRPRWPLYALLALVAAAAIVVGVLELGGSPSTPRTPPSGGSLVTLAGVTGYDPQGTGGEHDGDAARATDHNQATYWYTESYTTPQFGGLKDGVGLVLDAGRAVKLASVTVTTDTPGFSALIKVGNSPSGGFADDSPERAVTSSTTFPLSGATGRYFVVWITQLPPGGVAHVNEVTARG
jgi:hypothetical protein